MFKMIKVNKKFKCYLDEKIVIVFDFKQEKTRVVILENSIFVVEEIVGGNYDIKNFVLNKHEVIQV